MRRASILLLAAALAADETRAQEARYFEEPKAKPKLTFRWDALARYDKIYNFRGRSDIERGRWEVRPELALEFSDRFKIGARAVANLGTDERELSGLEGEYLSGSLTTEDNYRSDGVALERYYVEARPGSWTVRAGGFGMPLVTTEMLWDRDIQTPGAAVSAEVPAGPAALTLSAAGFYSPQRGGDRSRIGAGQAVFRIGEPERISFEAAVSYWHFELEDLQPAYIRQNSAVVRDQSRQYASDFRIADAILRLRFPAGSLPILVSLDGAQNFGAGSGRKYAFEGHVAVGRLGDLWDWRAFYTYQYVERDAVVGAYNTDDWWFHTDYRGHRTGAAVTIFPRLFVQGAVMFQERLDRRGTLNRITVDLVKMF